MCQEVLYSAYSNKLIYHVFVTTLPVPLVSVNFYFPEIYRSGTKELAFVTAKIYGYKFYLLLMGNWGNL